MNDLLQLKGNFIQRGIRPGIVVNKFPDNKVIESAHIRKLAAELESVAEFWEQNREIGGALVSVYHSRIIPKSKRLSILLSNNSSAPTSNVRGAKFEKKITNSGKVQLLHVFTYFVELSAIRKSVSLLKNVADFVELQFGGVVNSKLWESSNFSKMPSYLSKSKVIKVLLDCLFLDKFTIDKPVIDSDEDRIVTIYNTGNETKELLSKFGIYIFDDKIINKTTLYLDRNQVKILESKAPYLIAMNVRDLAQIPSINYTENDNDTVTDIPLPKSEPIIGVIDTHFDKRVYFSRWVDYINMTDSRIELWPKDYEHGTAVSSIIVDGPRGNPLLDDGCGRFRVRHFGVATHEHFSSFQLMKKIREIVSSNTDIKVWNLSLGSTEEVNENFISPEGAELDRLQSEYDVIFVVAGTNKPWTNNSLMRIGAPADSLNSVVVNSVNFKNEPVDYSRSGPVLSFFYKPDVSYYGGEGSLEANQIVVCVNDLGAKHVKGTSYAAPWITRKLAYMINILGFNKEVAKALLIDSACGWSTDNKDRCIKGYGVVPIKIQDVVNSQNDEIKFILTGSAEEYETFTYNLPVPIVKEKYPFYAKVTLAYFPYCDRNQGVDYTSTELDVHFGRVSDDAKIKSIDNNIQDEGNETYVYEEEARLLYRKWDNVKHLCEKITSIKKAKKVYDSKTWGISIKSKERLSSKHIHNTRFGVVITLKEMNGVNRIDEFIKQCQAKGWLVNNISIENKVNIYNKAEEEIVFRD